MSKLHSNQRVIRGIIHVDSHFPQIIKRKDLRHKVKGYCCDYPDWNDTLVDAEGKPYIGCDNCGAMCFD